MNKNITTFSSIAALLLGSSLALAHQTALDGTIEIPAGSSGYLNAGGTAVRTGEGDCLTSGSFSDANVVNACAGIDDSAEPETEAEPEPEAAPAPEPVKKEPIVTTATLGGEALFATGSSELTEASEQSLANLVSQLEKFQEISAIDVVGHTDATGDDAMNQALSEARAASVQAYLAAAFPEAAITSSGMGEENPVATNSTADGRAQNRRVEVQVTAKSITE
ncbi:MAG: OmpA family protein [Granulosicoccus sp.]